VRLRRSEEQEILEALSFASIDDHKPGVTDSWSCLGIAVPHLFHFFANCWSPACERCELPSTAWLHEMNALIRGSLGSRDSVLQVGANCGFN
jgi:hypothetical protein